MTYSISPFRFPIKQTLFVSRLHSRVILPQENIFHFKIYAGADPGEDGGPGDLNTNKVFSPLAWLGPSSQ